MKEKILAAQRGKRNLEEWFRDPPTFNFRTRSVDM